MQYFERAVLEWHPEYAGTPYKVLLSLLGVAEYQRKYAPGAPGEAVSSTSGGRVFPETGKQVGCAFLDYWNTHGGLAQFGYPISNEFIEISAQDGRPYRVQYFERTVFTYHMEAVLQLTSPPSYETVVPGALGSARYQAQYPGQLPPASAFPAPGGAGGCAPTGQGPSIGGYPDPDPPVRSVVGQGHVLTGMVRSSAGCAPVAGAKLVFWLAGPNGDYDDDHTATVFADSTGAYRFESNYPAFYGAGGPHIHLSISAPGYRRVETELFPYCGQTEGVFEPILAPSGS